MIAAMSKNRVIGNAGNIPWHIPEDFRYFKQKTLNKPIIMGRKTFESLPKVLPKRKHLIITRNPDYKVDDPQCKVYQSLEQVLKSIKNVDLKEESNEAFIIGGGEIYSQALKLDMVDAIYLTYINTEFPGDAFFPEIDEEIMFDLVSEEEGLESNEYLPYSFRVYERRK